MRPGKAGVPNNHRGLALANSQPVRWNRPHPPTLYRRVGSGARVPMNGLIYLVGLVVVIIAVLSFFGLR
jgi:hypothetical protein